MASNKSLHGLVDAILKMSDEDAARTLRMTGPGAGFVAKHMLRIAKNGSVHRPGPATPEKADVYDHKTDEFITQSEWDRRYPKA